MENELKINNSKTVLITGAGSGMGLATAKILIKNGFKVWSGNLISFVIMQKGLIKKFK